MSNKNWKEARPVKLVFKQGEGGQEGRVCLCVCVCVCVCARSSLGKRKCEWFLSGKKEQHRCVWPSIPVELFSVCLLYPKAPLVFLKRLWVIIKPVPKLSDQGEVCVLNLSVTNHTHTHSHNFFLGEGPRLASVGFWGFKINFAHPFLTISMLILDKSKL